MTREAGWAARSCCYNHQAETLIVASCRDSLLQLTSAGFVFLALPAAAFWLQVFLGLAIGVVLNLVVEVTRMIVSRVTSRTASNAARPASSVAKRLFLASGTDPLMSPRNPGERPGS